MIYITLNGERKDAAPGTTLAQLVEHAGLRPESLSTAINGHFVPREERAHHVLQTGDAVFTFQPITGG